MESRIFKLCFTVALLLNITQAMAQDSGSGDVGAQVTGTGSVECDANNGIVNESEDMLLGSAGKNAKNAAATIICTVNTNFNEWDLTIKAKNGGKLKNENNVAFESDKGDQLVVWVELTRTENNEHIKFENATGSVVSKDDGVNIENLSVEQSLPYLMSNKLASQFFTEKAVEAEFTIKAGVVGNKVRAAAGTYRETITLTIQPNDT